MAISKVIYRGAVLVDLTEDTVTAQDLALGVTAHRSDGEKITGTSINDADTRDGTALDTEILSGRTAYVNGTKLTGTMPDRSAVSVELQSVSELYVVPNGYHNGEGTVRIAAREATKIIPSNIKSGVEILGVTGTCVSDVTSQSKSVTPSTVSQVVVPDSGYEYLSQVKVSAIPYTETQNASGGITVTIGVVNNGN